MIPFSHQIEGAEWLVDRPNGRGYLADPPGFGKSLTLALAAREVMQRPLIVCPAIVRSHWARTYAEVSDVTPTVMSYDAVVRGGMPLMAKLVLQTKVDGLICDEAHYLKHAGSQRTQLLLGKDGYARRLPRVFLASGTPAPKNPSEMFTQACLVAPQVLLAYGIKTFDDWVERYCVIRTYFARGATQTKVVDVKNVAELKSLLDHFMLRRENATDVPTTWWQQIALDDSGMHTPDDYEMDLVAHRVHAAIAAGALESIANDPQVSRMRRRLGELKVAPVVELIKSQLADSNEKIAVFAYHRSVLANIRDSLASYGVVFIDGSVAQGARDLALHRFQTDPRVRVFVGQNKACGTGMDGLQYACSRGILVEPEWNHFDNVQLGARLDREGQVNRPVRMQMVSLANTLDDAVVAQNVREAMMASKVGL